MTFPGNLETWGNKGETTKMYKIMTYVQHSNCVVFIKMRKSVKHYHLPSKESKDEKTQANQVNR